MKLNNLLKYMTKYLYKFAFQVTIGYEQSWDFNKSTVEVVNWLIYNVRNNIISELGVRCENRLQKLNYS